jgi:phosphotransferase system HPr (HPr) family protein
MTDQSRTREVTITNPQGLHARPAHAFVTLANQFHSHIEIIKDGERVDGKSILSLLTLAAVQGTRLALRATGDDAEQAINALVSLLEQGFDEPDPPPSNGSAQRTAQ